MTLSVIETIYFIYIFLALYMLSLFVLIYVHNRKEMLTYPKGKAEPVSIIMPCFNEGKHIGQAIESLLKLDYPKGMIEIIVVDDKSQDNSAEIIEQYTKKYSNVKLIVNKRNSGGAAEPTNLGIRAAKYDYIAVADSDSTPDPDALIKMIGFLQDDLTVGGVTCAIMAKHRSKFIEKLQAIEYSVIAFTRKLLDKIDAVYVTPGPFALYRKKVLLEIGLFDTKNMTQDIEIVWRMVYHGYKARMCLATKTHSITPTKFKNWWKQRIRWNIGGLQTIVKYKSFFLRKGMLGAFILPFFIVSLVVGIVGISIFTYLNIRKIFVSYLATKLSVSAGTEILRLSELNLNPSILNFFGISLFILGALFTFLGLTVMNEKELRNKNPVALGFYFVLYLALYPLILITSIYKLARGKYSW
ncbi:glycosyltransferase family 2 protein [Candidatus Pacearchaeota archaeon]|nr:glycosyltransferase family 2 protein [Candidatus Pacearchaeota archaeon]